MGGLLGAQAEKPSHPIFFAAIRHRSWHMQNHPEKTMLGTRWQCQTGKPWRGDPAPFGAGRFWKRDFPDAMRGNGCAVTGHDRRHVTNRSGGVPDLRA